MGVTVFLTTHVIKEAEALVDRAPLPELAGAGRSMQGTSRSARAEAVVSQRPRFPAPDLPEEVL